VDQVFINTETAAETSELLNKRLFAIKNQRLGGDIEELALVIGEYFVATHKESY
jgi:phospholipid-transporting ATPase